MYHKLIRYIRDTTPAEAWVTDSKDLAVQYKNRGFLYRIRWGKSADWNWRKLRNLLVKYRIPMKSLDIQDYIAREARYYNTAMAQAFREAVER